MKAGKMTEEEAKAKMKAIMGKSKNRDCDDEEKERDDDKDERREAIGKRLKAAVKAGKMTEKEAWAKWKDLTEDDD